MQETIKHKIEESIKAKQNLNELVPEIEKTAKILVNALKNKNKILICGNGGSAADAQHFAAELVCRFEKNRQALPAVALTADTAALTAIANDFGYERVFARQVGALGKKGDVLVAISTSGNSPNVLKAVESAKQKDMEIIALAGKDGGKMKNIENCIIVPSQTTGRIQESHILIIHIWCGLIEDSFAGECER